MKQILFLVINVVLYGLLLYWLQKFWKVLSEEFGPFPVILVVLACFSLVDFKPFTRDNKVWSSGQPTGKAYTIETDYSIFRKGTIFVVSAASDSSKVAELKYTETGLSAFRTLEIEALDYLRDTRQIYLRTGEQWYIVGIPIYRSVEEHYYPLR